MVVEDPGPGRYHKCLILLETLEDPEASSIDEDVRSPQHGTLWHPRPHC